MHRHSDDGHGHAHGASMPRVAARPPPSVLRASLGVRLAIAVVVSASIWGAVAWARLPIGIE